MAKKDTTVAWVAAGVAAAGLAWLAWPRKASTVTAAGDGGGPGPGPVPGPQSPALLPPHASLLVVGDNLGDPLIAATVKQLNNYTLSHPDYAIAKAGILTTPGPASFESYLAGVKGGVSQTTTKADVILVSLGFTDAQSGVTDAARAAVLQLAAIFADETTGRRPAVLWLPPPDPGFNLLPAYLAVQIAITTLAVGSLTRPLTSTMLVPRPVPVDQRDTYFTADGHPTELGYYDWAQQVADKLLSGAPDTVPSTGGA